MPVTIQEMNVTTNVQSGDKKNSKKGAEGDAKDAAVNTELLIRECMQRILKELDRRKSR